MNPTRILLLSQQSPVIARRPQADKAIHEDAHSIKCRSALDCFPFGYASGSQ